MGATIQFTTVRREVLAGAVAAAAALGGIAAAPAQPASGAASDFQAFCAPCHGTSGNGDGPIAGSLKVPPADLTRISERAGGAFPATAVYDKIEGLTMPDAHGSREMPVWGDVFIAQAVGASTSLAEARAAAANTEVRIRRLVKYLKSIQRTP